MIRKSWFCLGLVGLLLAVAQVQAHFVWIAVQNDAAGKPQAHVWFSELAEADDEKLIDKIVQTKAWSRTAGSAPTELKLAKEVKDGGGALVGALSETSTGTASASCNYGVLDRRGSVFLLHYLAKYLDSSNAGYKELARDEALALDVVPAAVSEKQKLTVLFEGKPVAESEITVLAPDSTEEKVKTDAEGNAIIAGGKPGLYSIRAKWEVAKAGKEGDKEYQKVTYYCTLSLRVPEAKKVSTNEAADSKPSDAKELIRAARNARSSWKNFPGFQADVTVFTNGAQQQGQLKVSESGEVELIGVDDKGAGSTLRSLIGHRLAEESEDDNVSFVEEKEAHPMGRLMKFNGEGTMASTYRVKDGVIREVNRTNDKGRFTISVLEVRRNAEGEYLPGVYSVSNWNTDGSLKSTTFIDETWVRVGHIDLPQALERVMVSSTEHKNLRIEFSNYKLNDKTAAK